MALIAATTLQPGDYYAINTSPAVFATLKDAAGVPLQMTHLPDLQAQVGENVIGRSGGAVSLAIGMADIFSRLPGMRGLMAYWYHFAIMFEALFILTTIDAGTRVARFALAGVRRAGLQTVRAARLAAGLAHLDRRSSAWRGATSSGPAAST